MESREKKNITFCDVVNGRRAKERQLPPHEGAETDDNQKKQAELSFKPYWSSASSNAVNIPCFLSLKNRISFPKKSFQNFFLSILCQKIYLIKNLHLPMNRKRCYIGGENKFFPIIFGGGNVWNRVQNLSKTKILNSLATFGRAPFFLHFWVYSTREKGKDTWDRS